MGNRSRKSSSVQDRQLNQGDKGEKENSTEGKNGSSGIIGPNVSKNGQADRQCPPNGYDSRSLPEIIIGSDNRREGLKSWTPSALDVLKSANQPKVRVFQHSGMLSRIVSINVDTPPMIQPLTKDSLRGLLDRAAYWGKRSETQRGTVTRYAPPDMDIVRDVLALGEYDPESFPYLDSVTESPRFLPDGRLIVNPGYCREGHFYYAPSSDLQGLNIPDRPTSDDIESAKALLLNDLLVDFPFAEDASRANAFGLMLLPFVRYMIEGPTPNHHFSASTEGTGKGLCAYACAFPALGRELDFSPQKESEAEWRKALTSAFLSGANYFFIDNIINPVGWEDMLLPIDSGTLAMAWTVRYYRDRILGGNREYRAKINTIFMSSGNNVMFSRELIRRIVKIELITETENPSLRTGFKHDPLLDWALEHRHELVQSCLTLCRHWISEGRPPGSQVMGSYSNYVQTIGGILGACGVEGFLANRPQAVISDPDGIRWKSLVEEWYVSYQRTLVSTAELWTMILKNPELSESFYEILGKDSDNSQKTKLGKALRARENRIYGSWRIVRSLAQTGNKTALWRLQDPKNPVMEAPAEDFGLCSEEANDWTLC